MTLKHARGAAAITMTLVAALALAGCGAAAQPDGKSEINFTYPVPTSGVSPYEELAKAYQEQNPDVTINLTTLPLDSYSSTLLTQLRAGNAPDVLATAPGSGELSSTIPLAEAGLLEPVTEAARELVPAGGDDLFIFDDQIYGVPMGLTVSGLTVAGAGLQPLGLDPFPATIDELISKCGALSTMGVSLIVLAGGMAPNTGLATMTIAAGEVYADEPDWNAQRAAGEVTFADSEGWHKTLDTFVALDEGGCFQEGSAGAGFEVISNNLQQQTSVGAFIPGNTVGELVASAPDANWLVEPFPTSSGKPFGMVSSSTALSVAAEADNKDAALAFVEWAAEPEQAKTFAEISTALPSIGYADMDLSDTVYAPVSDLLKNGDFTNVPSATWPNAAVYDALATGVQGLLTGQTTPDQILEAMDAAWDS